MKYGICHLSVVPCRLEPSDSSEMVTQLLFGEVIKIYEEKRAGWRKIKTAFDDYDCWIDNKQYIEINETEFERLNTSPITVCSEMANIIENKVTNALTPILLGSSLPNFKDSLIRFNEFMFQFDGQITDTSEKQNKSNIAENAMMYLNAPYLWGGRSPFGIDCSGFTQVIYKLNGFKLPRDASQQATIGETLSFIEESESGDLAFFDNEEGNIIHVGIMLENNNIIHASGKVRIDKIDHQGIFNSETNTYSHRLRLIKKIL
ncbi:MAG: C40 family peptidase [Flavobacteriales bacterium]|nr:C40 family peptidase [Flavobacteriales bacterium]